jgi:hypothetical protein
MVRHKQPTKGKPMQYVLRTDKLSSPKYFAGTCEATFGFDIILTANIFEAFYFDDEAEALGLIEEIGPDDYTVSEVEVGMSEDLAALTN